MLTWFAVCVCVRFYMLIFTWYKGTYSRSIKTDGQESYARNTAFSETWQNGDPISSFSGHSGIYSDILSVFFLAYVSSISADILSGILPAISSEILCGWGLAGNTITLWSGACGWGPAGNTLIRSLWWRSSEEHFDPEHAVRSGGEHSNPELAAEIRRGTLWSGACGGGLAANTAIQSLQMGSGGEHSDPGGGPPGTWIRSLRRRSGGEHSDLELAVEARRVTLSSRACSWVVRRGFAGSLWSRGCFDMSGGEHCDLELAVEVRWGSLWSRGCCSGPAGNTAIESLQLRSGGKHSDPVLSVRVRWGTLRGLALAVRVRRGSLWSWACCSGPEGKTAI